MNRFACIVALCLLLPALPALAGDPPAGEIEHVIVRTEVVDDYALQLRLANLQKETTKVEIKHLTRGTSYFSNYIRNHNGYATRMDLQKLPKGKYVLEISQQDDRRAIVMRISEYGLFLSEAK